MSDQNGGQNESSDAHIKPEVRETDVRPDVADVETPLYGRTRTPPVIEGVATETHPEPEVVTPHEGHFETPLETGPDHPHEAHETLSETPLEAQYEAGSETAVPEPETDLTAEADSPHETIAPEAPEAPLEPEASPTPPTEKPRKSPSFALAAAAGVVALGAGGYYGWTGFVSPSEQTALIAEASRLVGMKPHETQPEAASPQATQSQESKLPEAAAAPVEPPKAEETPAPVAEPVTKAEAPASTAPEPAPSEPKLTEPEPAAKAAAEAPAPVIAPAPAEPVRAAAADPATSEKLARVTAQLAETQSTLAKVTQRLQSVEALLTAPKVDNRAELEARANGLSRVNDASARVILAQSLLTALRQGDDFSSQLAGLQGFDGDSPRVLSLRQGLAAPSAAKLATTFAALAPKLAEAAAPKPADKLQDTKAPEAKTPRDLGATILSFLQVRAEKLVKIRPVGAPESDDETGARLKRIEADLRRGDVSAALEERSHLPEPALVLSADWAKGAQARLDAELAAKAELSEALQALSKSRS